MDELRETKELNTKLIHEHQTIKEQDLHHEIMINHFKDTYEKELENLRNTKKPIVPDNNDSNHSSAKVNILNNSVKNYSSGSEVRQEQLL